MEQVCLIGSGGINSWSAEFINTLNKDFEMELFVKIFDDDTVEEKNILNHNQNFTVDDLMQSKAEVLGKRYSFDYDVTRITESNLDKLEKFDIIILGVDNNKTRKLLYEYAIKNNKRLLDLRAQGTNIMYNLLDNSKGMEYYNKEYFSNEQTMERVGSCQLPQSIEDRHIENGNRIISYIGIFGVLLKVVRGEKLLKNEFRMVY